MTSWCVAIAPIAIRSPSSRMRRSSEIPPRSISMDGAASRSRSTGMRLCPPARILASSPASCSAATASSTVPGLT